MAPDRTARYAVKVEDLLRGRLTQPMKCRHGLIDSNRRTAMPFRRQHHVLRVVSHDRPIALAKTSRDSACVSRIFCSMTAVGTFDMTESAATISSNRPVAANSCSLPAVSRPAGCIDSTRTRGCIADWLRRSARLNLLRNFIDDLVDVGLCIFAFGLELDAHFLGCRRQQLLEQLRRQI